ncbi:Hypothetical predicted protein [Mytilus galloprovincialis]|uniref:Uncharacterized protein n=1 Tax=Mytilus galloprovincialis TaxID=29158 RepID=A0A8B6C6W0_MYTGA|nr:Hypothetical predicted protein [Mytilus galloprovincialis]
MIIQEAGADDCTSRQIESCSTNLTNTLQEAAVEGDKNKKCRAAHILLHCLKKIVTDCNLDPNNSTISQILPRFQHEISQYGCETANGARSLVNNFVVMIFGLTFYKLLKGKTESILFGPKKKLQNVNEDDFSIEVESKSSVKYLGMIADKFLSGEQDVDNIIKKANQ